MEHSTDKTAVLTEHEPPNGTVLVVKLGDDEWKVIVRLDAVARDSWDASPGDHWFDGADNDSDPMALHEHVKYADAVYALGEPLAVFRS